MGRGGPEPPASGEMDDNSLSPEACYECKINGYPKRGRKRRSTNETDASDLQVCQGPLVCRYLRALRLLCFPPKDTSKSEQSPQRESPVILLALAVLYKRPWGWGVYFIYLFWLPLESGSLTGFTHLLISSVSPRRKSNAYPVSADRTRSEVKGSKWAEWHAHMGLPTRRLRCRKGSSMEKNHGSEGRGRT